MSGNQSLKSAYKDRNDEFYTQLSDIEKELRHYRKHFKNKIVFCNCDDPFESNFFKYFVLNFNRLGLKKLISTCYSGSPIANTQLSFFDVVEKTQGNKPYKAVVTTVYDKSGDGGIDMFDVAELFKSGENELTELKGNGDFRSNECIELLKESDIVVTNPPFSLFREYVAQLMKYSKKFLIIGNQNAITYKDFFVLLKNNDVWLGNNNPSPKMFYIHNNKGNRKNISYDNNGKMLASFGNVCWFTNLDIKKRHEELILIKHYDKTNYPIYDNFDAINVDRVTDIPSDYAGIMGVPITFMDKYNPNQFEIIGMSHGDMGQKLGVSANFSEEKCKEYAKMNKAFRRGFVCYTKDNKLIVPYMRILIRNKHPEEPRK